MGLLKRSAIKQWDVKLIELGQKTCMKHSRPKILTEGNRRKYNGYSLFSFQEH